MKKEYWFEEMRLSLVALKKARTIEQVLKSRREFETETDSLLRLFLSGVGVDVHTAVPTRPGFFKRLIVWLKLFKGIF